MSTTVPSCSVLLTRPLKGPKSAHLLQVKLVNSFEKLQVSPKNPISKHRLICQPGCCAQVRPPDHRHQCHHPRRPPLQCLRQAVGPKGHRKDLSPILLEIRTPYITTYTRSSMIFFLQYHINK